MPIVIILLLAFLFIQKGKGASIPAGANSAEGIGTKCGGIGGFIKGHVDRKNAVAPKVIQGVGKNYGVPIDSSTASTIAKYADTFSLSNKVEGLIGDKVGDALCNLDPLEAAAAGAKFLADKVSDAAHAVASGAEYVAGGVASGAKSVATFGVGLVKNPLSGVQTLNSIATKTAGTSLSLSSRAAGAVYNSLPTPLKIAAAPAYAVEKVTARVTSTVVSGVSGVAKSTTSAISSGVKSATSAVSSGVSKVLGFL